MPTLRSSIPNTAINSLNPSIAYKMMRNTSQSHANAKLGRLHAASHAGAAGAIHPTSTDMATPANPTGFLASPLSQDTLGPTSGLILRRLGPTDLARIPWAQHSGSLEAGASNFITGAGQSTELRIRCWTASRPSRVTGRRLGLQNGSKSIENTYFGALKYINRTLGYLEPQDILG